MKRIWIVTELFYPEETSTAYILTKVAERLTTDFEVHVICGPALYDKNSKDRITSVEMNEELQKVIIHRTAGAIFGKNNLVSRSMRFVILSSKLAFNLFRRVSKGDKILIVTNPAPLIIFSAIIKRLRGCSLNILVHDIFPENAVAAKVISQNSFFYKFFKPMFDKAYSQADLLIVLGRDMKNVMMKKLGRNKHNTKIEIIENWAQPSIEVLPKDINEDKINIQYAGNLGRVQGLLEFADCIKQAANPDVTYSFYGHGAVKKQLEQFVHDENLSNVQIYGAYKRDEQNAILSTCDIALVTLAEGMYGLGVPSKSYNIMAAGKPILFIGELDSEIACMVKEHSCGFCFEPTDKDSLVVFLQNLKSIDRSRLVEMGSNARKLVEEKYSKTVILDKFLKVLS